MIAPTRTNARPAFTLTEMLVVVAIIVVLAGIAVPITLNVLSDAKKDAAMAQIRGSIAPAIKMHFTKNGEVPIAMEQLLGPPNGTGSLPPDAMLDPWSRPYQFTAAELEDTGGISFLIWSEGPNPGNPNSKIEYASQ